MVRIRFFSIRMRTVTFGSATRLWHQTDPSKGTKCFRNSQWYNFMNLNAHVRFMTTLEEYTQG